MHMRALFDAMCAFIFALALLRIVLALMLVIITDNKMWDAIVMMAFAWVAIEATGAVRKHLG